MNKLIWVWIASCILLLTFGMVYLVIGSIVMKYIALAFGISSLLLTPCARSSSIIKNNFSEKNIQSDNKEYYTDTPKVIVGEYQRTNGKQYSDNNNCYSEIEISLLIPHLMQLTRKIVISIIGGYK